MAQHDYNIDNAAGAVVRADLNNLFEAVASLNSAATAPAATFANMPWFDTSTNLLKQRNNANTEWIVIGLKDANGWTPYRQGVALGDAATLTKDTDGTMAANSDSRVPTQKAARTLATTKISKTIAGEIAAMTEKETLAADDLLLIEDSAGNNAKKKVKASNIRGGANYQVFTSNGTWVKPSSGSMVIVEAWGGGGGGGNMYGNDFVTAGGGGGGGYARRILPLSAIAGNVTVVVGAGGVGGVPAGNVEWGSTGNAGGVSTFGTHLTAFGGGAGNAYLNNRCGGGGGGAASNGSAGNSALGVGGFDGGGNASANNDGNRGTGYGGGAGGSYTSTPPNSNSRNGGGAMYGGGGGASARNNGSSAGGVSMYAGNGARNNTAAGIPGGGGCGMTNSGNGNGARGEVRVWVV